MVPATHPHPEISKVPTPPGIKDSESVQCRAITDITRGALCVFIYRHTSNYVGVYRVYSITRVNMDKQVI